MMMPIDEFKQAFNSYKPNVIDKRFILHQFTEVELCDKIKIANLFPNYTLHEEVGISGVSCDMVYENGKRVFTIEAKTELNYKVFAQASRWRNVATASFVAVPTSAPESVPLQKGRAIHFSILALRSS